MKMLSARRRTEVSTELRDRFSLSYVEWLCVVESSHYPLIMQSADRGAWSYVRMLLDEVKNRTDR